MSIADVRIKITAQSKELIRRTYRYLFLLVLPLLMQLLAQRNKKGKREIIRK